MLKHFWLVLLGKNKETVRQFQCLVAPLIYGDAEEELLSVYVSYTTYERV